MKFLYISVLVLLVSACGVVQFREVALYDVYEEPPAKEKVSQIIYEEAAGTMWNSLFECGDFEITNKVSHSGNSSIKISWNKAGCEWIGFGNSFNNWNGADMSEERFKKALSLYVRTQEKEAGGAPIVANLEDFEGGGSYHFIGSKNYLRGLKIDTNWTQMIVPLWHFPVSEDEVNIYAIKQMQFQLEGSGSFYLDDIQLIDFSEEEYQKMLAEVEAMKPHGAYAQEIYPAPDFDFYVWGHENDNCHKLQQITDRGGEQYIEWSYDKPNCNWASWGINWNGWYPINLRGVEQKSKMVLELEYTNKMEFEIALKDFKGHSASIFKAKPTKEDGATVQKVIEVPLSRLNLSENGFVIDQIRELHFKGIQPGTLKIKQLKITE